MRAAATSRATDFSRFAVICEVSVNSAHSVGPRCAIQTKRAANKGLLNVLRRRSFQSGGCPCMPTVVACRLPSVTVAIVAAPGMCV